MACPCCGGCEQDGDCNFTVLGGGPCDGAEFPVYFPGGEEGLYDALAYGEMLAADCQITLTVDDGIGICCDNACYPFEEDLPAIPEIPLACPE